MPSKYYCEYIYTVQGWTLIAENHPSDYYCPSEMPYPQPPGSSQNQFTLPTYLGSQTFPDQPYFVDYEYANGKFTVVEANVPQGYHAPADPLAFAKKTGRLRIFPVSMSPGEQPRSAEENEGGNADKYLA